MTEELTPFICDGISLGIPNSDASEVSQIDNALFLDENGELHFRDEYIRTLTDILGDPIDSIKLQDLLNRMKGVYIKDGKLYLYDSSLTRAYSLNEIIGAYNEWKNKLTNGGIFWIGRTQINSSECNNIKIDITGDPTYPIDTEEGRYFVKDTDGNYINASSGTKVFSIDRYLLESEANGDFSDGTFRRTATNEWRWHNIPNLQIVIPPVDLNMSAHILAKLNVRLIKTETPIIFRLYDLTADIELDRVAIANDSSDSIEQQITLTQIGQLTPISEELQQINCQCPNTDQQDILTDEPAHTLIVQFYVDEILTDSVSVPSYSANASGGNCVLETIDVVKYVGLERRIIGLPNTISDETITNSSIDVILYNVSGTDNVGRKSGSISFTNNDLYLVKFETAFSDADYQITISCNKNINIWYTNKKSTEFTIRAEKKFTGTVDWSVLKLKTEGVA